MNQSEVGQDTTRVLGDNVRPAKSLSGSKVNIVRLVLLFTTPPQDVSHGLYQPVGVIFGSSHQWYDTEYAG